VGAGPAAASAAWSGHCGPTTTAGGPSSAAAATGRGGGGSGGGCRAGRRSKGGNRSTSGVGAGMGLRTGGRGGEERVAMENWKPGRRARSMRRVGFTEEAADFPNVFNGQLGFRCRNRWLTGSLV
jgi:hypothetical protein